MDTSIRLQLAMIVAAVIMIIVGVANIFAMDRLEQQVIRIAQAVEGGVPMAGSGGMTSNAATAGSAGGSGDNDPCRGAEPGAGTGFMAKGWQGATAEITCVEGNEGGEPVPGNPRTLAQKPRPQGDWYVNRRNEPPGTINYFTSNEGDGRRVMAETLGRLMDTEFDAPTEVIPRLAVSWDVSEDGLVYTYTLRRGVQFADGRPFTSADVKFSFDVIRDPDVNAEHLRSKFEDVVKLETPDAHTVKVTYRQRYWKGLYTVGTELYILNKGWYEEHLPAFAEKYGVEKFATEPGKPGFGEVFNKMRLVSPGTEAYYLADADYEPEEGVELIQNPFYWGIQVHPTWHNFKGKKWVYISDPVAAFEEFRKEKFDVTVVDFQQWDDELKDDPTVTDISDYYEYDHTGLAYSGIWWNGREAPLDDPKVRYALAHLIDREWIKAEIERGRGQVAVCPTKPIYGQYNHDLEPIPFDPKKARALLEEAGWKDTDGDGILDKDGQRFEIEIKYGSARRFYTQVSAQLSDAAQQAGIRIAPRQLEWATFIDDFYERNFDGAILYNSFPDAWVDSYADYHSSQDVPRGENHTGWKKPEIDKLLEDMRQEFDSGKRDAMYREFCATFHAEQPMSLLVHGVVGVLIHDRIEGVNISKRGMQPHEFWVKPENVLHK